MRRAMPPFHSGPTRRYMTASHDACVPFLLAWRPRSDRQAWRAGIGALRDALQHDDGDHTLCLYLLCVKLGDQCKQSTALPMSSTCLRLKALAAYLDDDAWM